jgi:hypothetical protein
MTGVRHWSLAYFTSLVSGVGSMIAKLAKICTLRISPDKLNFILSDKLASGGVSMWCELEQVSRSSQRPQTWPSATGKATDAHSLPTGELFQ